MWRNVVAVLAGYVLFAAAPAVLFGLPGRDPHVWPGGAFVAYAAVVTAATSLAGGYLAATLARPAGSVAPARWLAGILAAIAIVSAVAQASGGSVWSELLVVLVGGPALVAGALLRGRRGAQPHAPA